VTVAARRMAGDRAPGRRRKGPGPDPMAGLRRRLAARRRVGVLGLVLAVVACSASPRARGVKRRRGPGPDVTAGLKIRLTTRRVGVLGLVLAVVACSASPDSRSAPSARREAGGIEVAQVPGWSRDDLEFFLHGSMGTEVLPERVLRAFVPTNPDLFPRPDLSHFGLIADPAFGWPIGFSRRQVPHLGGLSAVGVNCAACHVGQIVPEPDGAPVRVLGMTSLSAQRLGPHDGRAADAPGGPRSELPSRY
jgi:hypothetical protein